MGLFFGLHELHFQFYQNRCLGEVDNPTSEEPEANQVLPLP